jgi:hypothetical protein
MTKGCSVFRRSATDLANEQLMADHQSKKSNMLAVFRREFLCGHTRESAKAKWGEAFDDKAWDYVEKIGRADPEEALAHPHLRDILKWEYDHPRPHNEALEKWGAHFEAMAERHAAHCRRGANLHEDYGPENSPAQTGPDLDRE